MVQNLKEKRLRRDERTAESKRPFGLLVEQYTAAEWFGPVLESIARASPP